MVECIYIYIYLFRYISTPPAELVHGALSMPTSLCNAIAEQI